MVIEQYKTLLYLYKKNFAGDPVLSGKENIR